ncbi:hypothetical protein HK096_005195, partial [Nowakowskiella sp. JEL0078]
MSQSDDHHLIDQSQKKKDAERGDEILTNLTTKLSSKVQINKLQISKPSKSPFAKKEIKSTNGQTCTNMMFSTDILNSELPLDIFAKNGREKCEGKSGVRSRSATVSSIGSSGSSEGIRLLKLKKSTESLETVTANIVVYGAGNSQSWQVQ